MKIKRAPLAGLEVQPIRRVRDGGVIPYLEIRCRQQIIQMFRLIIVSNEIVFIVTFQSTKIINAVDSMTFSCSL